MTWYKAGRVTVAHGSTTVTGANTRWAGKIKAGDIFSLDGDRLYEIVTVTDGTLTLATPYAGASGEYQPYVVIQNFTSTTSADLAGRLAKVLQIYEAAVAAPTESAENAQGAQAAALEADASATAARVSEEAAAERALEAAMAATAATAKAGEAAAAALTAQAAAAALEQVPITPTGTIQMFAGLAPVDGWLRCDGSAVSRVAYADLFAAIGAAYGAGDGETTFHLPAVPRRHYAVPGADGALIVGEFSPFIATATSAVASVGAIRLFPSTALPAGWLECTGAAVSRVAYADLFSALGTAYGSGDGETTFALPTVPRRVVPTSSTGVIAVEIPALHETGETDANGAPIIEIVSVPGTVGAATMVWGIRT